MLQVILAQGGGRRGQPPSQDKYFPAVSHATLLVVGAERGWGK